MNGDRDTYHISRLACERKGHCGKLFFITVILVWAFTAGGWMAIVGMASENSSASREINTTTRSGALKCNTIDLSFKPNYSANKLTPLSELRALSAGNVFFEDTTDPADAKEGFFQNAGEILDHLQIRLEDRGICDPHMSTVLESCRNDPGSVPTLWPVVGAISSVFGARRDPITGRRAVHKGLDMCARYKTVVQATADGIVTIAGWQTGYGRVIYIDHGNGLSTRYAHLSKFLVKKRAFVKRGDPIGWVGSTGRATGPHLHYEVRWYGEAIDPRPFLLVQQ